MININFINVSNIELVDALGNKVNVGEITSPTDTSKNFYYGENIFSKNDQDYYHFAITGSNVELSGVIGQVTTKQQYTKLFAGCTEITKADQLTLTATDLTESCFAGMFLNCSNLKTPPTIAATGLAIWCYSGMFAGCSTLSTAPALPATTLAPYCYYAMFYGCSKLSASPYLPAETLTSWCYNSMFYNCSDLARISCNFSDWSGNATSSWVTNVADVGLFINENVRLVYSNSKVPRGWQKSLSAFPLTFKAVRDNSDIGFVKAVGGQANVTLQYSKNNGTWTNYTIGDYITLNKGETVAFSGNNNTINQGIEDTPTRLYRFGSTQGRLSVYGNVQSLVNNRSTLSASFQYYGLMRNRYIVDASKLFLPSNTTQCCYSYMFENCNELTAAPQLPATTLANACYEAMFEGCERLSTAPALPATKTRPWCYKKMFEGCDALTSTPQLPATTITLGCYQNMFYGCYNLLSASELPATTLANYCYDGMFIGCSNLSTAPALPAATLCANCYRQMFNECSSLKEIDVAFTIWAEDISATEDWVGGIRGTGTFKKPASLRTITGRNYIPNGRWTVVDKS